MYKTAATELLKTARRVGVTRSLLERGYSPEAIKLAYVQQGLPVEHTSYLLKEAAGWGTLAKTIGEKVTTPMAGYLKKFAPTGTATGARNQLGAWASRLGLQAGTGMEQAARGMAENPWGTLGGGVKNFGKGLTFGMFGEGKGIGGLAGKSTAAYGMVSPFFQGNQ